MLIFLFTGRYYLQTHVTCPGISLKRMLTSTHALSFYNIFLQNLSYKFSLKLNETLIKISNKTSLHSENPISQNFSDAKCQALIKSECRLLFSIGQVSLLNLGSMEQGKSEIYIK